jgi:hypothetical protein
LKSAAGGEMTDLQGTREVEPLSDARTKLAAFLNGLLAWAAKLALH